LALAINFSKSDFQYFKNFLLSNNLNKMEHNGLGLGEGREFQH
jgi:hypothetical protein